MVGLPCSIKDLIPQKGKMAFDQHLQRSQTDDAESVITVGADNIFLDDRHDLSESAIIEFVNQLNAGVQSYNGAEKRQPVRAGLFVGVQEAEFLKPVHAGDVLTIRAFVTEEVGQVTFVQGIVFRGDEKVAQLLTKLYQFDEDGLKLVTPPEQGFATPTVTHPGHREPPDFCSAWLRRKLYMYLSHLEIGSDFISFAIACPGDFEAFDGHFPDAPILPGIVLLEIGKLGLELLENHPVVYTSVKKMKISGMVLPDRVISCVIKTERQGFNSGFSLTFKGDHGKEISRCHGYYTKEA